MQKPKFQATWLQYVNGVMTSCVGRHYQPTLWDALWTCARPCKLTLLASSFKAEVFPRPNVGVRFWFGFTQRSSICPCHLITLFYTFLMFMMRYFGSFSTFISFATWCGTFVWYPAPLKERWCPHHILCFFCFFVDLLWNSFIASWACSVFDSFTQDASIGWYPFHLTKYYRSRPLSLIWARPPFQILVHYESGRVGALRHHGRLTSKGKHEMWDEFSGFPVVLICKCQEFSFPTFWMDPHTSRRTCGSNLLATEFFWCSSTLHLLLQNSPLIGTWP